MPAARHPGHSLHEAKVALRLRMRERRRAITPGELISAASLLTEVLGAFVTGLGRVPVIAGFAASRHEADPRGFLVHALAAGTTVVMPRVNEPANEIELYHIRAWDDLAPGFRGIIEPSPDANRRVTTADVGLFLVPGLAFDRDGGRLGQGGGHYDRLLASASPEALLVGVAYPWQLDEPVPSEPHDCRMHWLATPEGMIACRR